MAGHDTVVLVHGIGDGEVQGDFLVDVAEPLVRWVAANGGEQLRLEPASLRRGARPAGLRVTGRLPDPDRPDGTQPFEWHLVEARWSDEFKPPPERTAAAWSLRTAPLAVVDQVAYYDTLWRFWRLLARLGPLGPLFRLFAHAPAPLRAGEQGADEQAWRYRYDVAGPFWRYKLPYALWFGLAAPLLLLALASVVLLPLTPLWLLTGRLRAWQHSYYNALYRLIITAVWLPVIALAMVLLLGVTLLTLLPFAIPRLEALRKGVLNVLRLRFADAYVFSHEWVDGAAVEAAVARVIESEAPECRSLTVIAHSQGAVVAYEALAALARPLEQPALSAPYVTVTQALSAIDRPLPRPGLALTLITVGGALNRTLGWRRRRLLADPLPAGTRWIDIWSVHDPVPMGSLDRRLIAVSGAAPTEVRVANTLTPLNAHTTYWPNTPEVIAVVAEELVTAGARPAPTAAAGAPPTTWQPRAPGLWAWRARHGRSDRACALGRRARVLYALAILRAAGYLGIAAVTVALFVLGTGTAVERATAAAVGGIATSAAYLVAFVLVEACALAFARWWWERPCAHTTGARG